MRIINFLRKKNFLSNCLNHFQLSNVVVTFKTANTISICHLVLNSTKIGYFPCNENTKINRNKKNSYDVLNVLIDKIKKCFHHKNNTKHKQGTFNKNMFTIFTFCTHDKKYFLQNRVKYDFYIFNNNLDKKIILYLNTKNHFVLDRIQDGFDEFHDKDKKKSTIYSNAKKFAVKVFPLYKK